MSRDIKIKFLNKAPAGFESGDIDFCSKFELKQWQDSGEYKMEVIEEAKSYTKKPKAKKKSKKKSKKK